MTEVPDAALPMFEEGVEGWLLAGEFSSRDLALRVFAVCRREGVELRFPRRSTPRPPRPIPAPPDAPPVTPPAPSPITTKPRALPDDARSLAARMEP